MAHDAGLFRLHGGVGFPIRVQRQGELAIELLEAGFAEQLFDAHLFLLLTTGARVGKSILLLSAEGGLIGKQLIIVEEGILFLTSGVTPVGHFLLRRVYQVLVQQSGVFDHIAQGVDVFGAVTTSFHQHMGKFITLIVELFVIHVQGGIGLDLVIEGGQIHLATKRIGLEIVDEIVDPVVQGLPLPLGKALASRKVGQSLGEGKDELALLTLKGFDVAGEALIDIAAVEGLLVDFCL